MKSMTGFGYAAEELAAGTLSIELKSYNGKYLDIYISLPADLTIHEAWCREEAARCFSRGKVEVTCRFKASLSANIMLGEQETSDFSRMLSRLRQYEIHPHYSLNDLERWGVFRYNQEGLLAEPFRRLFNEALQQSLTFRENEGLNLIKDIMNNIAVIGNALTEIKKLLPEAEQQAKELLKAKLDEALGSYFDEKRLLEETAVYIVRTNINEEIIRLESHVTTLSELFKSAEPIGRKLDFLCQELNREANTINSKTPFLSVQKKALLIKEAIDKIREQARNVE
jgi:uncharacterized protein (TIGR00255 family)